MKYAHIIGWGSYLPERILTNDDMAHIVDTSDEWIYTRTGIRERRIAGESETTATLAFAFENRNRPAGNSANGLSALVSISKNTSYQRYRKSLFLKE